MSVKEKSTTSVVLRILAEFFLSLVFLCSIAVLAFLTSFSFSIFAHREYVSAEYIFEDTSDF